MKNYFEYAPEINAVHSSIMKTKWWFQTKVRETRLNAEATLWKFRGGYVCVGCGTLTRFKNPEYTGVVNGRRLMLGNSGTKIPFGKSECPHCIMRKVDAYFDQSEVITKPFNGKTDVHDDGMVWIRQCDFLKEELPTVTGIRGSWAQFHPDESRPKSDLFLIIGAEWWNGFNASREAIRICLTETGVAKTPILCFAGKTKTGNRKDIINALEAGQYLYKDGALQLAAQNVSEIKDGKLK